MSIGVNQLVTRKFQRCREMSSNNQDSHNLKPREYKVVILGDGGVGKSGKEIKQKGTKVEKFNSDWLLV
jgi:uncharacterized protein with von Willebrand factor type A (vWA) domain